MIIHELIEMHCLNLQRLQLLTESYLENGEEPYTVDILKEMTSKLFNLSTEY